MLDMSSRRLKFWLCDSSTLTKTYSTKRELLDSSNQREICSCKHLVRLILCLRIEEGSIPFKSAIIRD